MENKAVIYPKLSYKIVGILFDVWNSVGYGHKEEFYQNAIAKSLKDEGISFKEQLCVKVLYKGEQIGLYRLDFLIENKLVLEIKRREFFSKKDIEQLYAYLKATHMQLGIIAHFTRRGVAHKRILNIR